MGADDTVTTPNNESASPTNVHYKSRGYNNIESTIHEYSSITYEISNSVGNSFEIFIYFKFLQNYRINARNNNINYPIKQSSQSGRARIYGVATQESGPFDIYIDDVNYILQKNITFSGIDSNILNNTFFSEISSEAFADFYPLGHIILNEEIEHIGSLAFDGCTQLTQITFPRNIPKLKFDRYAFSGIQNLTSPLHIPNFVTTIPSYFLYQTQNTNNDLKVYLNYVEKIENNAFDKSSVKYIHIHPHLKQIEHHAFTLYNNDTYYVSFDPIIYDLDGITDLLLVNYDISSNNLSSNSFYLNITEFTFFQITDMPSSGAWYDYFNSIVELSEVDVSFSTSTKTNIKLPNETKFIFNVTTSVLYGTQHITDVDVQNEISGSNNNFTYNQLEDDIIFLVGLNTYYKIILESGNGDVNDSNYSMDDSSKWDYQEDGVSVSLYNNCIKIIQPYNTSYWYIQVLSEFNGDLYFSPDPTIASSPNIHFRFSYNIINNNPIYPLSSTTINQIMYSDNYVCLDTSSNGSVPDDINDFDNIINDTIYFGIKFNDTNISYDINLVQNLDTNFTPDIYTGYIEQPTFDKHTIQYRDSHSLTTRYFYNDEALTPVLSWNGESRIMATTNGIGSFLHEEASKLILNNREVTCYFVYNDLGHVDDVNPPYIIDLNDYI